MEIKNKKRIEMEENELKFVAFLDILGFKKLVENNLHKDLIKKFENFLLVNKYELANGHINQKAKNGDEIFQTSNSEVNLISISDSIILYTNDNSSKSFINIVNITSNLLSTSLKIGFPLRGSIAMGNFSTKSKTFTNKEYIFSTQLLLGKALVEAYEIEGKQKWSGCIIQKKCIDNFINQKQESIIEFLKELNIIIDYEVPLKKNNEKFYVVNWIKNKNSLTQNTIKNSFSKHNKDIEHPDIKEKIENTINFYNFIVKNNKFIGFPVKLDNKQKKDN